MQVYLQDKNLLERRHAEQYLMKPRFFEYFKTEVCLISNSKQPTAKTITALAKDLGNWFENKETRQGEPPFSRTDG